MAVATIARRIDLGIDVMSVDDRDLISLTDATQLIRGRNGKRANVQVVQRYANPKRGRVVTVAGEQLRLVLPTVGRTAGKFTTRCWIETWKRKLAELMALADEPPSPVNPRTSRQERKAHERAMKELAKAGFTSAQQQAS